MKKGADKNKRGKQQPSHQYEKQNRQQPRSQDNNARGKDKNKTDEDEDTGSSATGKRKSSRGNQDTNNRFRYEDFNKDLDEDNYAHKGSKGGFEEFDEYADETAPGTVENDSEYNSRYNDDRDEEEEGLGTDNDLSQELETKTTGEKQGTPYAQTEDESQHNEPEAGRVNKGNEKKENKPKKSWII